MNLKGYLSGSDFYSNLEVTPIFVGILFVLFLVLFVTFLISLILAYFCW